METYVFRYICIKNKSQLTNVFTLWCSRRLPVLTEWCILSKGRTWSSWWGIWGLCSPPAPPRRTCCVASAGRRWRTAPLCKTASLRTPNCKKQCLVSKLWDVNNVLMCLWVQSAGTLYLHASLNFMLLVYLYVLYFSFYTITYRFICSWESPWPSCLERGLWNCVKLN